MAGAGGERARGAQGRVRRWLERRIGFFAALELAVLLYVPLRFVLGRWMWPLVILDHLIFWPLAACAPLFALALWLRRKVPAAVFAASLVLLCARFGPQILRSPPEGAEAPWIRVMTLNIASGLAVEEDLVPLLRACGADVIALQEVGHRQAPFLRVNLLEEYPHRSIHGLGIPGKAILSRHPILEHELFDLDTGRPYLRARIDVGGVELTVITLHVPLGQVALGPFGAARDDVAALARMAAASAPAVLLGDFNASQSSVELAPALELGLRDAFGEVGAGLGFTFPVPNRYRSLPVPRLARIDHVLCTPDLRPLRSWVGPDGGSDHRPVIAELARAAGPDARRGGGESSAR